MCTATILQAVRQLPAHPFRNVRAAVSTLSVPAGEAPPLRDLCAGGIPGFTAEHGARFCSAASNLHPRHQLPHVLSRVAASNAIAALTIPNLTASFTGKNGNDAINSSRVVFTGSRRSAWKQFGCEVSMSHEDSVAAALAWVPIDPASNGYAKKVGDVSMTNDEGQKGNANAEKCVAAAASPRVFCAIDVCPVTEVHRVRRRFPLLGQRWMPQCVTDAAAAEVSNALACAAQTSTINTPTEGDNDVYGELTTQNSTASVCERRREWWRQLPTSDGGNAEAEAYASLVLAQHWGARECAVKLLGISNRAFPYACLVPETFSAAPPLASGLPAALPFTAAFLRPHTLYCGVVTGTERGIWEREGREPVVSLYSWFEWYPLNTSVDMPVAVVAACCSSFPSKTAE